MRILIISDTHGYHINLQTVLDKIGKIDMLIHCGDMVCQVEYIKELVDCPVIAVRGNNDFFLPLEKEEVFYIDKYKVMVTHGHHYNVSLGVDRIAEEAKSREVDVVMHGHTHRPNIETCDNVTILCPGSISYPRQEGKRGSYIVMNIDRAGEAHYTIDYIEE